MSTESALHRAMALLDEGRIASAFVECLVVAVNESEQTAVRALAWQQMGVIARFNPPLTAGGAETGLFYYEKAIALDPTLVDAWYSIVQDYGVGPATHQDLALAREGMRQLRAWERGKEGRFADGVRTLVQRKDVEFPELRDPATEPGL